MLSKKIIFYSFTSLALTVSGLTFAEQDVYVPTLEGGFTASVGLLYLTPSSDLQTYFFNQPSTPQSPPTDFTALNVTPGYSPGIDASLGYIFEDTANGIELDYRNITTSDKDASLSDPYVSGGQSVQANRYPDLGYELNAFDLMFSQFMDIGNHMQMRFLGGLAYTELEYDLYYTGNRVLTGTDEVVAEFVNGDNSKFKGWGPRVGIDGRYDFGQGFGIVGGGSVAYYLGELEMEGALIITDSLNPGASDKVDSNELENHGVQNIRANLGIDYVYFFDDNEQSTLGLELGYLVDYYDDAAGTWTIDTRAPSNTATTQTSAVSFSGPYLNLKGAF